MKVLITGATGFIGQALSSYLLGKGYTVNYLTMDPNKVQMATRYHGYVWNPYKDEIDLDCLKGVDVIVHLAGENISGSWSKRGKQKILNSRLVASRFLYKTLELQEHQVKQIVCASAIGIYSDLSSWQTETDFKISTGFLGEVVQKWEEENNKFQSLGLDVCLLRIGLVLSAKEGALPHLIKPIKWNLGAVLGTGEQFYSWIHIEDLIRIFSFSIEKSLGGVYNAVAPNPVKHKELMKDVAQKLNKWFWLPAIPTLLLHVALGDKKTLVTEGQKVSSEKLVNQGFAFKYSRLKEALNHLLK